MQTSFDRAVKDGACILGVTDTTSGVAEKVPPKVPPTVQVRRTFRGKSMVRSWPLTLRGLVVLGVSGCIDLRGVAKLLRRRLLKTSDRLERKLRLGSLTCIGVPTEAS